MGAQLVSIRNAAENEFVRNQLRRSSYYYYYNTDEAFIGLTDLTLEGQWAWDDGSVTSYLNFDAANNEPNNWHGMEDCVTIKSSNGTWSDKACNLKRRYVCKKNNETTVKPTNFTSTILPDTGYCEQGWKLYGSKCYLIRYGTGKRLNFKDAQSYCQQWKGGNLVSIHKSNENAFLLSQLHDVPAYMLIGLTDSMYEGTYLWTDQSSVDYTNWNRYYYYGTTTNCVHFHGVTGKWVNRDCKTETSFICQKSSSTSPPTTTYPVKDDPEPCPTGYKKFMKSCYKFSSTPATYEEALRECRKEIEGERGDLVSLHNTYEQAFVFSQFARNAASSWIGLRKSRSDNNFKWSDSSLLDFSNWQYSYYNSYYRNYECVRSSLDGKWKTASCTSKYPFTCKITRKFDDEHLSFIGNCTEGWSKIKDKCYKYFSNSKPWAAARENCKAFGGNLATITNAKQELKISSLAGSVTYRYYDIWIGLNDRAKELYFQWSSGLPLPPNGYTNWAPNKPDDNSGRENCVEINTGTLYWDDVSCSSYNAYVCEHPLECHNDLGMEDGSIPDESITATSYIEDYFPWYARVNRTRSNYLGAAWCTNITSGDQSLTISLGEVMQITRISTQGLRNYTRRNYWGYYYGYKDLYVMSYVLEYSNDGTNWIQYIRDGDYEKNAVTMPGNVDGNQVEGTTVDIQAAYLRFTPKRFKNAICMRVELYGCKSICRRALGMENYRITKEQIKLSSVSSHSKAVYIRPNVNGNYWCAKDGDTNPFININLSRTTKVTRITAISNDTTLKFRLLYSSDGITYAMVETHTDEERIFSTGTHDLEKPVTAQYIKISPFNLGVEKVCLQVELYGCLSDCNTALGMASKTIKDRYINASTALGNNPASNARLNSGSYNSNSWCASRIDTSQYLEVDFRKPAHITEIAVQGHNGDIAKYVKKYLVQWSNDFNFWHQVPEELPGNTDGYSVERRKLKVPIDARYIRINPSKWKNGICMRVEFYGCSLSYGPSVKEVERNLYNASIRLMNETFVDALRYSNSSEFKNLSTRVEKVITKLYISIETFKYGFHSVKVNGFRNGSVIVDLTITSSSREDVLELLIASVKIGRIGPFTVDKDFPMTYGEPEPTAATRSDKKTLSVGVIAGVTVSACVLGLLIGAAAIYCIKFRRGRAPFDHSSFDNSIQTIQNFEST